SGLAGGSGESSFVTRESGWLRRQLGEVAGASAGVRTPASTSSTHAATRDASCPPLGTGIPRRPFFAAGPVTVVTVSLMAHLLPRTAPRRHAAATAPRPAATHPEPPWALRRRQRPRPRPPAPPDRPARGPPAAPPAPAGPAPH